MTESDEKAVGVDSGRGWVWLSSTLVLIGLLGALGGQIFGIVQLRQFDAEQRVWRTQAVEREAARKEDAAELTSRRNEVEELKVEISRLTVELKGLRDAKTMETMDAAAERAKRTDELAALNRTREELTQAEADLRVAQVNKLAAEREREALMVRQGTLTETVNGLKTQRDKLFELVAAEGEKVPGLTKQIDDLEKRIVSRKAELQIAELEVNLLTRQQETLKSANLATEMELKPIQDRIKSASAEEDGLRKTQVSLRATVQMLTQEKVDLDTAMQELDSKRVSILKEIKTSIEKLDNLKKEIAEAAAAKDSAASGGEPSTPDNGNGKGQP